jgi:hypothetical protein
MKKVALIALLAAGIVGWAVRQEASLRPASEPDERKRPPRLTRDQIAQKVRENAPLRDKLRAKYPDTWRELAQQTRRDLSTCVVTEMLPGVLKADCL